MTVCPHRASSATRIKHDHVTLDLDNRTRPPSRYLWYSPKNRDVVKCVHWRVSAGGHGLHIIVCLRHPISAIDKFIFRMWNHDDIWRLSYDMIRYDTGTRDEGNLYATGVLFDLKNGREAGPWH